MLKQLSEHYFVIDRQLHLEDIAHMAQANIQTIICNRPDAESEDQPDFALIEKEAKKLGIEALFLPISSGEFTPEAVEAFSTAMDTLPTPILGYCRTGTRATVLWALSQKSQGVATNEIIDASANAGYNVFSLIADAE